MTWRQPTRIGGAAARTAVVPSELAVQPAAAASAAVATASAHLVSIRKANLVPSYPVGRAARHDEPLDPLTGDEIVAAVAVVREARDLGERVRFVSVELREPAKEALAAPAPRRARRSWSSSTNDDGMTHEAVVSLDERRLVDWRDVPGRPPRDPHRRVRRRRERDRRRPALPRGARQARDRATPTWSWSTPGRSAASRTATAGSRAAWRGCVPTWRATTATRARSAAWSASST